MIDQPTSSQHAEFGTLAGWTAELLAGRDRAAVLAGTCRGSGSPAALAWLAESLRLDPDTTLLDVGAGLGGPLSWAAERYSVRPIGLEPMTDAAIGCHRLFGLTTVVAGAAAVPLADRSVDAAWALGVLDTIDRPAAALREVRRVLRDDGRLGVLAYVAKRELDDSTTPDGNQFQTLAELEATLGDAGFVAIDRLPGGRLADAPIDWQAAEQRIQAELEAHHSGDERWIEASTQEDRFRRLLDAGDVSMCLIYALCV